MKDDMEIALALADRIRVYQSGSEYYADIYSIHPTTASAIMIVVCEKTVEDMWYQAARKLEELENDKRDRSRK